MRPSSARPGTGSRNSLWGPDDLMRRNDMPAFRFGGPSYTRNGRVNSHGRRGMKRSRSSREDAEETVTSGPREGPPLPSVEEAAFDWNAFRAAFPTTRN